MAKKKELGIEDAVNYFKEIVKRMGSTSFTYLNGVLKGETPKNETYFLVPSDVMWAALYNDTEFMAMISEYDITQPDAKYDIAKFKFGEDIENGWIDIDPAEMCDGKIVKIALPNFTYDIEINKGTLLVRLKKDEYTNFAYKIIINPQSTSGITQSFCIKKKFDNVIPGMEFTLIRAFYLI